MNQVVELLGEDMSLSWGSDFPHVRCTFPNSRSIVEDRVAGMSQETVDRIAFKTAAELYSIDLPVTV